MTRQVAIGVIIGIFIGVTLGIFNAKTWFSAPAGAASVVEEWSTVKAESPPTLKPATVNLKTTALMVMDIVKGSCNEQRRPRCVASIPTISKFMSQARAKGMPVINTVAGTGGVPDILPGVAPKAGEKILTGTVANKFIRTDLEKTLHDKGITTVILAGTSAQGAVLYTASEAAFLKFTVIVPIDGASSESLFAEQAVVWLLANSPGVAQQTTLTSFDMIKF